MSFTEFLRGYFAGKEQMLDDFCCFLKKGATRGGN